MSLRVVRPLMQKALQYMALLFSARREVETPLVPLIGKGYWISCAKGMSMEAI
jgi:hypothetical protein